jgi:hypothetical protein
MGNLLFSLLSVILEWSPRVFVFLLEKFPRIGAPGITFVTREHDRPKDAKFRCKIYVDISNDLPGQSVRLAHAHFVFEKNSPLNPDPQWSREYKTGRFQLCFFSPPTKMHDWRDVYLRSGEKTNVWIGVDPQHSDYEIENCKPFHAHARARGKRYPRLKFKSSIILCGTVFSLRQKIYSTNWSLLTNAERQHVKSELPVERVTMDGPKDV